MRGSSNVVGACRHPVGIQTMGLHKKTGLICKREGCLSKVTRREMVYCCRECAPYGNYGLIEDGVKVHKRKIPKYSKESKAVKPSKDAPKWLKNWRVSKRR